MEDETKATLNTIYTKLTANDLYGSVRPYTFNTNTDVEMRSNGKSELNPGNGDEVNCFYARALWGRLKRPECRICEAAVNHVTTLWRTWSSRPYSRPRPAASTPNMMQQMYGE